MIPLDRNISDMAAEGFSAEEIFADWCYRQREQGWIHGDSYDPGLKTDPRL